MKKIFLALFCFLGFLNASDENAYYISVYREAKLQYPLEKEFITILKPSNPDDVRSGGYLKFRATILYNDKNASKEFDMKVDIIRHIILDVVTGQLANDLQSPQGRIKLANLLTASVNAILTDAAVVGFAFPDFVIQP